MPRSSPRSRQPDQRPDQERTDERAQPAGGEQDPDPGIAGVEDVAAEHRQQHDHAGAHPEGGLRQQERRQGPVAAGEAHDHAQRLAHAAHAAARSLVVRSVRALPAKDRWMPTISSAEAPNEAALTANAASRPRVAATRPPSAAPTASIVPQAEPIRTLASASSSPPPGSAARPRRSARRRPRRTRAAPPRRRRSTACRGRAPAGTPAPPGRAPGRP